MVVIIPKRVGVDVATNASEDDIRSNAAAAIHAATTPGNWLIIVLIAL